MLAAIPSEPGWENSPVDSVSRLLTYEKGGKREEKILIIVEQTGSNVNVSFRAAGGGPEKGAKTTYGAPPWNRLDCRDDARLSRFI